MVIVEIVAFVFGVFISLATLWSAILTVVVPRAERAHLTRIHFFMTHKIFDVVSRVAHRRRDAIMGRYAPVALIMLPFMWSLHIVLGFALMYWALGTRGFDEALVLSGSSLATLGFRSADDMATLLLAILEAGLGLIVATLMISYLPTLYSAFLQREHMVAHLEIRAGRPPRAGVMIPRLYVIGQLTEHDDLWTNCEDWFINIEETHTTHPSLVFFESAYEERSWLTTAGSALDAASLVLSSVDLPTQSSAAIMVRAGFLSLNQIATNYGYDIKADPAPDDPISVTRGEYDALIDGLEAAGVPVKADRDQAWRDFAGWRVNYDEALGALCALVGAPAPLWSEDPLPVDPALAIRNLED